MSLIISDTCINCDLCEPECPNDTISQGEEIYVINPHACTECVGHYVAPRCVAVCPINCIVPDPAYVESNENLFKKYLALAGKNAKT